MNETTKPETANEGRVAFTAYVRQCILKTQIKPLSHREIGELMNNGFKEAKLIEKACHFAFYGRKY